MKDRVAMTTLDDRRQRHPTPAEQLLLFLSREPLMTTKKDGTIGQLDLLPEN